MEFPPQRTGFRRWVTWLLAGLVIFTLAGSILLLTRAVRAGSSMWPRPAPGLSPDGPSLQVAPDQGGPGTALRLIGRGWQPHDTVFLRIEDPAHPANSQLAAYPLTIVSTTGQFTAQFVFPARPLFPGTNAVTLTVWSPYSGDQAAQPIRLAATAARPALTTARPASVPGAPFGMFGVQAAPPRTRVAAGLAASSPTPAAPAATATPTPTPTAEPAATTQLRAIAKPAQQPTDMPAVELSASAHQTAPAPTPTPAPTLTPTNPPAPRQAVPTPAPANPPASPAGPAPVGVDPPALPPVNQPPARVVPPPAQVNSPPARVNPPARGKPAPPARGNLQPPARVNPPPASGPPRAAEPRQPAKEPKAKSPQAGKANDHHR